MSNNATSFRLSVISMLHAKGFSIFGGAVRDILSGEFNSSDWSGDIDALSYYGANKVSELVMEFLHPQSAFMLCAAEQLSENLTRLTLSSKDLSNKIQVDLVSGQLNSYNYGCGFADDEREFLDLDVNGLQLTPYGIALAGSAVNVGVSFLDVLANIRSKQFRVLKALNGKRIEKVRKLEAAGWVQVG